MNPHERTFSIIHPLCTETDNEGPYDRAHYQMINLEIYFRIPINTKICGFFLHKTDGRDAKNKGKVVISSIIMSQCIPYGSKTPFWKCPTQPLYFCILLGSSGGVGGASIRVTLAPGWDTRIHKTLLLTRPHWPHWMTPSGGRLNKKDGLTGYGNSHVKDKTS